ncbi:hypothetical protein O6P43_013951 [Quillaja saponaria]|uniref:Uncharacterized protein n=1 Tax=Quillaja saponaria TaxID=32244 RepID=A0AAD7LTJ7_QUISA|nr:hypothetical protein O6P43_013951 [Quillaja saponaria]
MFTYKFNLFKIMLFDGVSLTLPGCLLSHGKSMPYDLRLGSIKIVTNSLEVKLLYRPQVIVNKDRSV